MNGYCQTGSNGRERLVVQKSHERLWRCLGDSAFCDWLFTLALTVLHWCLTVLEVAARLWRHLADTAVAAASAMGVACVGDTDQSPLPAWLAASWPQHVSILLAETPVCWRSLARAVECTVEAARHARSAEPLVLSIYDSRGLVLANSRRRLFPLLQRAGLVSATIATIDDGDDERLVQESLWISAAAEAGDADWCGGRCRLVLLSGRDGVARVAAAARRICRQAAAGQLSPASVDVSCVDACVALPGGDPQLVVRLGGVPSLCGYPPWQLRLAEILQADERRPLTRSQLVRLIARYSKIERRQGA